jgi:hypothetical protein
MEDLSPLSPAQASCSTQGHTYIYSMSALASSNIHNHIQPISSSLHTTILNGNHLHLPTLRTIPTAKQTHVNRLSIFTAIDLCQLSKPYGHVFIRTNRNSMPAMSGQKMGDALAVLAICQQARARDPPTCCQAVRTRTLYAYRTCAKYKRIRWGTKPPPSKGPPKPSAERKRQMQWISCDSKMRGGAGGVPGGGGAEGLVW